MHNFFCTTSLHARPETLDQGRLWAQAIGATFIERQNKPLADMFRELAVDALLIYTATGPEIQTNQGKHKFQLSMAELRIQQLRKGGSDHFLRALQATGPLSLLDCTCGFGSDSIVASFGLPPGSTVAGLESSPYLYAVTSWGLQHFVHAFVPREEAYANNDIGIEQASPEAIRSALSKVHTTNFTPGHAQGDYYMFGVYRHWLDVT